MGTSVLNGVVVVGIVWYGVVNGGIVHLSSRYWWYGKTVATTLITNKALYLPKTV